jgi:hypothetical protein
MITNTASVTRLLHTVAHLALKEGKRVLKARMNVAVLSCLVAVILGIDYKAALILFTYLDPTLDGASLGPAFLALTLPVAVVAVHLLIKDEGGEAIEKRLRKLAGVGVFVFLLGIAMLLSLVYFDASEGIGSSGSSSISGTIGNDDLGAGTGQTSSILSGFGAILSGLSPTMFFAGMTFILFVTVYASHVLMKQIEAAFDVAILSTRRAKEVRALCGETDRMLADIARLEGAIAMARKKLPGDPEYAFSQLASSAIRDALHAMKKALASLKRKKELDIIPVTTRVQIPDDIETPEDGKRVIAGIRQATTPYAILKELDGLPPHEED